MFSVIICSIDPAKYEAVCNCYGRLMSGEDFEIIGIHDAKSLCEGYNRGIKMSKGEYLIFSHDDLEILNIDFIVRLKKHLLEYDIVGLAGTTRLVNGSWISAGVPYLLGQMAYPEPEGKGYFVYIYGVPRNFTPDVQAVDGVFFATRRNVAEYIAFDEENFDGFHLYDLDFSFSSYLFGFRVGVCMDIAAIHYSKQMYDHQWSKYKTRFEQKFSEYLLKAPIRLTEYASVFVKTKEEILEVMGLEDSLNLNLCVNKPQINQSKRVP